MPIRDNRSDQVVNLLHNATIATDTDTNSTSIDTADFDFGVFFTVAATAYTDGTYAISLEDSPDNSVFTAVSSDKLIGSITALAAATSASGGDMGRLGCFSTEQFVRVVITSTSTTSGADILVASVMAGEYNPQA